MKKQINTSILFLALIGLLSIPACDSDDVSPGSSLEIIALDTENAYKGDFLDNSVVVKVNSSIPHDQLRVRARQIDGEGYSLSLNLPHFSFLGVHVDEKNEAEMFLSLGCEANQTFRFSLIKLSNEFGEDNELASLDVTIMASDHPSDWRRICGIPILEKLTTLNGTSYLVESTTPGFPTGGFPPNISSRILTSNDFLSWEEFGAMDNYIYDIDVTENNVLHVLTPSGIETSLDGNNWESWAAEGLPLDQSSDHEIITPVGLLAEDSVVFVTFESTGAIHHTYRSRDKGVNWESIPSGSSKLRRLTNGDLISLDEQNGLFLSHDSGTTWESLVAQSPRGFIRSFEVVSDNELVVVDYEEFGDSKSVYRFNLSSLQFSEILSGEESILDVQVADNTIYILGSLNVYTVNSTTQSIVAPDFKPPHIVLTPFPRGFNRIIVAGSNEFIVAQGASSFANF